MRKYSQLTFIGWNRKQRGLIRQPIFTAPTPPAQFAIFLQNHWNDDCDDSAHSGRQISTAIHNIYNCHYLADHDWAAIIEGHPHCAGLVSLKIVYYSSCSRYWGRDLMCVLQFAFYCSPCVEFINFSVPVAVVAISSWHLYIDYSACWRNLSANPLVIKARDTTKFCL